MNKSEAFGYFLQRKFDAARDAFAALSDADPSMRVNRLWATALNGEPDWDMTAALSAKPDPDARELFYLATAMLEDAEPEKALELIDAALEKEPLNIDMLLKKAQIFERLNRGDDVKALFEKLLRDFPNDERVLCAVAAYVVGYGQTNQALYLIKKALKINRVFTILQEELYIVLTSLNKEREALRYAEEAAGFQEDDFIVLYEKATLSALLGKYEQAERSFARLDDLYGPLDDKMKSMRADALFGAGDFLRAFDTALEISPEYFFYDGIRSFLQKTIYLSAHKHPEQAKERAKKWRDEFPDDPFVGYVCASVCDEPQPVPDEYVKEMFDSFAPDFDNVLLDNLNYKAPDMMRTVLEEAVRGAPFRSVLDLGCGTGLGGKVLLRFLNKGLLTPSTLTGVDLSGAMLDEARNKAIYTDLVQANVLDFLPEHPAAYDLIAATDVLLYFPDPSVLFERVEGALTEKGLFVFSFTEAESPEKESELQKNGTYKHSLDFITNALAASSLEIRGSLRDAIRTELNYPQYGYVVLAGKKTS